jgi:outer membrane protein assembly factor BamB
MEAEPTKPAAADPFELLFVGTHGHVTALHKFTGKEAWRVSLPDTGWSIVSLLVEDGVLYAASKGHVFALDPASGSVFWKNALPGLGHDHACLATLRQGMVASANPVAAVESIDEARRHAAS